MNELHLQDKFLIPFFTDNINGLGYREVKANTITSNLIIEEDLKEFLGQTILNKSNYYKLLKKYNSNEEKLIKATELKPVSSGANVLVLNPYDVGVFYATQKVGEKNIVSNIQLYLDLYNYKGRGREQAEYLREKAEVLI